MTIDCRTFKLFNSNEKNYPFQFYVVPNEFLSAPSEGHIVHALLLNVHEATYEYKRCNRTN